MKYFKLPDLGEGLQEADIIEWHVKAGDDVQTDQIIVSVETAKAIVDIPSPRAGTIGKVCCNAGNTVHIGEILVEFVGENEDQGTVVGKVESRPDAVIEDNDTVPLSSPSSSRPPRALPAVRFLARERGLDLDTLQGSGRDSSITLEDIERAHAARSKGSATAAQPTLPPLTAGKPLQGARKRMAQTMTMAQSQVVKVTLCDDADIDAWAPGSDPTQRLVRAIISGCRAVPVCNAWFDGNSLQFEPRDTIDLGVAIDTADGLFVPVMRDIGSKTSGALRAELDQLRRGVSDRSLPPASFTGASISLSNFGTLAGRYADPVVVPPMVAIVGAGRIRPQVVACGGEMVIHRVLPLSLSIDHRALTGGDAARFLRSLMDDLALPT